MLVYALVDHLNGEPMFGVFLPEFALRIGTVQERSLGRIVRNPTCDQRVPFGLADGLRTRPVVPPNYRATPRALCQDEGVTTCIAAAKLPQLISGLRNIIR